MNNKGFTLVELLATLIILGAVMGIATFGVISAINKSKEKSEKIFVEKIGTAISSYLATEGRKKLPQTTYTFQKCRNDSNTGCETKELIELNPINILDITEISTKTLNKEDLINPKNKQNCFEGKNPQVRIFKDSDSIYYYYLDLTNNNSCEITNDNAVISNLIKSACEAVGGSGKYKEGGCDFRA